VSPRWRFAIPQAALALGLSASIAGATMPALQGPLPPEVTAALREGLFTPPAAASRIGVSAAQPAWRVPVILASFSDDTLVYGPADFDQALFDSTGATATGSARDYFTWASAGRLSLTGRVVATVRLPQPRSYYTNNSWGLSRIMTPNNSAGFVHDALLACPTDIPWGDFDLDRDGFVDMLWVVHPGIGAENRSWDRNNLWSITSQLSGYWSNSGVFTTHALMPGSLNQYIQVNRFSVLPERSYFTGQISEIGVYCHEFGHAMGLPDLYDASDFGASNAGPGNWSLMGTGVYGGDGRSPQYPTHVGAWPALFLGWAQAVRPTRDTTIVLAPLGVGTTVLELWLQGVSNPEHFLVEARKRQRFDRNLPGEGLIVYHVNDATIGSGDTFGSFGLILVEADGNADLTQGHNRGDAGDVFPGSTNRQYLEDRTPPPNTLSFHDAPTGVGLYFITPLPEGTRFLAQVQPLGWQSAVDRTMGEYAPSGPQTPGAISAIAADGRCYSVESEYRSGRRQIVLRTNDDGVWSAGIPVTNSAGEAVEPSLALLGYDDLAVTWSDTRDGPARPYYRARVNGYWTPERPLPAAPGEARAPVIATDGRGEVYVAWCSYTADRIECMRFPYLSPYGQPFSVSNAGAIPDNPSIAASAQGGAVVAWTNGSTWPPNLWYSFVAPDAVPTVPARLTGESAAAQSWASLAYGPDGFLHCIWIETSSSSRDLCYERLSYEGSMVYEDTTLESSANTLANARVACDSAGGIHVTFESVVSGVTRVMYRRRQPSMGWDESSTSLTTTEDGTSVQPRLLPTSPSRVTVLYRAYSGGSPRFMERVRANEDLPNASVWDEPIAVSAPRLLLGPNPLRPGQTIRARWISPAASPGAAFAGSGTPVARGAASLRRATCFGPRSAPV
jgi:M6 family metalloprotease-like protein